MLNKTDGQLMIAAGHGDQNAAAELKRRWEKRTKEYAEWRVANPGRSAAAAFS